MTSCVVFEGGDVDMVSWVGGGSDTAAGVGRSGGIEEDENINSGDEDVNKNDEALTEFEVIFEILVLTTYDAVTIVVASMPPPSVVVLPPILLSPVAGATDTDAAMMTIATNTAAPNGQHRVTCGYIRAPYHRH